MTRSAPLVAAIGLAAWVLSGCADDGPTSPDDPDREGAGRIVRLEILSEPDAHGTYLVGEEVRLGAWVGGATTVEAEGSVWLGIALGRARQPAELVETGDERLEFAYRIRRGDYDGDGISVPAGELEFGPGAALTADGAAVDPAVLALEAQPDHRVFGKHEAGETVAFTAATEQLPAPFASDEQAVGCRDREVLEDLVRAVLGGDFIAAASRYTFAAAAGECAELVAGEPAIFLSAAVFDDGGDVVDLVLAYGPARLANAGGETANWWTLGDFITAP